MEFPDPQTARVRDCALPFIVEDWRALSPENQAATKTRVLAEGRKLRTNTTSAPLMKVLVARIADDEWWMVWTWHHALLDGRSQLLILRDVSAASAALAKGTFALLPKPKNFPLTSKPPRGATTRAMRNTGANISMASRLQTRSTCLRQPAIA